MAVSDVGDRKSFPTSDTTSFDYQGYCLTVNSSGEAVKATGSDAFMGTNFISSEGNTNNREIRSGEPVPVEQDGWVNVLCKGSHNYQPGDLVFLSTDVAGVAVHEGSADADVGGTEVGKVMRARDTSALANTDQRWVVVSITGRV